MAEQEAPSIRETLNATIESYDNDTQVAVPDSTPETGGQPSTPAEDGQESAGYLAERQPQEQPLQPDQGQRQPGVSVKDTPPQVSAKIGGQRGPASWKPEVRAKWDTLPVEVKTEVIRREREIQAVMQDSKNARAFTEDYMRTIAPYQHLIMLEAPDGDVLKVFREFLQTATVLRNGTPQERASAMARAIQQYGVDVQQLDGYLAQMLAGQQHQPPSTLPFQQPQQPQQQLPQQQQQFRDPRMDQLLHLLQQQRQEQEENTEVRLETEIDTFAADPKNKYFEVLRTDMSTILATGAEMGRKITLKQAYDLAAQMHPDVSRAMRAQRAGPRVVTPSQQAAGSSITNVTPRQTGETAANNTTVRSSIEQAINQLGA